MRFNHRCNAALRQLGHHVLWIYTSQRTKRQRSLKISADRIVLLICQTFSSICPPGSNRCSLLFRRYFSCSITSVVALVLWLLCLSWPFRATVALPLKIANITKKKILEDWEFFFFFLVADQISNTCSPKEVCTKQMQLLPALQAIFLTRITLSPFLWTGFDLYSHLLWTLRSPGRCWWLRRQSLNKHQVEISTLAAIGKSLLVLLCLGMITKMEKTSVPFQTGRSITSSGSGAWLQ